MEDLIKRLEDYSKDWRDRAASNEVVLQAIEVLKDPCRDGCQYSKDVGMWPQYNCHEKCMYKKKEE